MGFYGNITNTSRTTFQFDKIYPNRYEMDGMCSSDGVYNGRYVLIEYDSNLNETNYRVPWFVITKQGQENKIYASIKNTQEMSQEQKDLYNADLFEYAWENNLTSFFNYFNGVNAKTALTALDLENYPLMYLEKGHVFEMLNDEVKFVFFKRDGTYTETDFETFSKAAYLKESDLVVDPEHPELEWTEDNVKNNTIGWTEADYNERGIYFTYVANDICFIKNSNSIWNDAGSLLTLPGIIRPGYQYNYNIQGQFWQVSDSGGTISTYMENGIEYARIQQQTTWTDNFTTNFNKDKQSYKTSRGYDSTVWQKLVVNGVEKYVMIAELNTVVPTFGISADPPSLVPINPHWGSDSTNVYYDLHWQPQWSLRVKAANNKLTAPIIDPSGEIYTTDINGTKVQGMYGSVYLRDISQDAVVYPSDVSVSWSSTFEDSTKAATEPRKKLYYDTETKTWMDDSSKTVPAAIYYNKNGFSSTNISYSDDLLDETKKRFNLYRKDLDETGWKNTDNISITPTGLSGNIYNRHDGVYGKKTEVDTQELSIMLPSIGNVIANIWDIVYGGRNTSGTIASTNKRNKDISWENGPEYLYRKGLRLRSTVANDSNYQTDEVETLAGCINTAHDLFGMIIVPVDGNTIEQNASKLSADRIYYNTDDQQYYRKHLNFEYIPLDDQKDFVYQLANEREALTNEKIHNGCYYILVNGEYVNVNDVTPYHTYNQSTNYYYKTVKATYIKTNMTKLEQFPYDGYEWYQDKDLDILDNLKANYIKNPVWKEDKVYYRVTAHPVTVGSDYEEDKYYYLDNGNFYLEVAEIPDIDHEPYYKVDFSKITDSLQGRFFQAIYVPGKYFYKHNDDYILDNSIDGSGFRQYSDDNIAYEMARVDAKIDEDGNSILYKEILNWVKNSEITERTYLHSTYYIFDPSTGKYLLSTGPFDPSVDYYEQQITYKKLTPEDTQYEIETSTGVTFTEMAFYRDNTYYKKVINPNDPNKVDIFEVVTLDNLKQSGQTGSISDPYYIFGEYTPSGQEDPYREFYQDDNGRCPFISLRDFIMLESKKAEADDTYEPIIEQVEKFYYANTYHFLTPEGSYILDKNNNQTSEYDYYKITKVETPENEINYFDGDDYYYYDTTNQEYVLITNPNDIPSGVDIYTKSGVYVDSDLTPGAEEHLAHGSEWNVEALSVPQYVTLAKRTKVWEMQRLPNYAIDTSTINGLLLQIEQRLEVNDTLTRDTNTVSGGLNKVKDIIARFNTLRSNELTIVDMAGRVHSAPTATNQRNSLLQKTSENEHHDYVNKDIYPQAEYVKTADVPETLPTGETGTVMNKQWITVNVDGDLVNPRVTIHHNYQSVKNRPTTYNINDNSNILSEATATLNSNTYSTDNLEFYIPIVDEMGHIVGNQNKTVTLPYNFKKITTNGSGTGAENGTYDPNSLLVSEPIMSTSANETIIAENSQDIFRLNSYNKWIRIRTKQQDHTITIAHATSDAFKTLTTLSSIDMFSDEADAGVVSRFEKYTGSQDYVDYNLLDNSNKPLDIWYYTFDKAGHLKTQTVTAVTLPYSWKVFKVMNTLDGITDLDDASANMTSVIPTNTTDDLIFYSVNKWIKVKAEDADNNHYIRLGHLVQAISTTASTEDFNNTATTFVVDTVANDEAGHITGHFPKTYTLPYNWKTISIAAQSTSVQGTTGTSTATQVIATTPIDTFNLNSGNKYITLNVNSNNKTITIGHAASTDGNAAKAGNHTQAEAANTLVVNAHRSFAPRTTQMIQVPYITIDEVGHVTYLGEDTIQLPGFLVENGTVDGTLENTNKDPVFWATFGVSNTDSTKDALKVYKTTTGSLPIHQVSAETNNGSIIYYTEIDHTNDPITLIQENNFEDIITNRLEQLDKTNWYTGDNLISELTTTHFQRTKWLTDIAKALRDDTHNQVEVLSNRIKNAEAGAIEYDYNQEQPVINLVQLTERVAILEDLIKHLITIDETTDSLKILSQEEIAEALEWQTVSIQFTHADTNIVETKNYIKNGIVKREDFTAYTGNDEVYYYDGNNNIIEFPFIISQNIILTESVQLDNEDMTETGEEQTNPVGGPLPIILEIHLDENNIQNINWYTYTNITKDMFTSNVEDEFYRGDDLNQTTIIFPFQITDADNGDTIVFYKK